MKNLNLFKNFYKNSKYIPYGRQNISSDDINAVVKGLDNLPKDLNIREDLNKRLKKMALSFFKMN